MSGNNNLALEQLNNNAAALMTAGKFQDAYKELRMAVQGQSSRLSGISQSEINLERSHWNVRIASSAAIADNAKSAMFPCPLEASSPGNIVDEVALTSWLAIILYNMGLACHKTAQACGTPPQNRHRLLQQARTLYIEAYGLNNICCIPVLALALCNNTLDIAMEHDADLLQVSLWNQLLEEHLCHIPEGIPEKVVLHFCAANLYYSSNFAAARAA